MRDLLAASVEEGTSRQAALTGADTFGKTGTTQDSRDALFVGFANGLVCGVWIGNDDDSPNPGLAGGGIPARIWRDFMTQALGLAPRAAPQPAADEDDQDMTDPDAAPVVLDGNLTGLGLDLKIGQDGNISLSRNPPVADRAPRPADAEPPATDQ
jgi:penicillin-binding protein 1A